MLKLTLTLISLYFSILIACLMILVWRTLKVEAWMLNLDVACMESSSDHPLVSIPLF